MSRKAHKDDHGEIHADERWLITYADMITLLLAVFIVMYALSDTNLRKFNAFAQSLSSAFTTDVFSGSTAFTVSSGVETAPDAGSHDSGSGIVGSQTKTIRAVVNDYAIREGLGTGITVEQVPEGIAIRIESTLLFQPGRARLAEGSLATLEKIAATIQAETNDQGLRIIGHTDDTSTAGALYADNFELSTARAMSVMRFLIDAGIPATRMRVEGDGQYQPLVPNTSDENRAKNRRVDILILYPAESPVDSSPSGGDLVLPSLNPVFGE